MDDTLEEHRNVLQTSLGHLAAIGLEKVGRGPWGNTITPATWVYNAWSREALPTSVDVGYWGVGIAGGAFAPVSLALSYIKAWVDDDIESKVAQVRATEATSRHAPGVLAVIGWGTPSALAADYARVGATAWQHPNGVWVTAIDGRNNLIIDYKPRSYMQIRRPYHPLRPIPGRTHEYFVSDKLSQ